MKFTVFAVVTLPVIASAIVNDPRGDNPGTLPSTPQEELAKFHLPPGFEIQLVAAEPEIQKPINFNFDAAGRLWVTGSELYPWPASTDPNGQPIPDFDKGWRGLVDGFRVGDAAPPPSPVGKDTVRILSDFGPDGHARKITVFADKLNIPSGIQPLPRKPNTKGDSAIVYSIPNIWLLTDVDGDGFAEKREPLYTGFGYTDTHGGSSSYIYWIDGWIYGTHGFRNHSEVRDRLGHVTIVDSGNTYRFRPDGTAFEIYTHGQTNPFGLAFDPLGNLYSADSHSKPVYMLLRGGYYEGIGKQHDGLGFAPRITDDDHGSSAIGGIIYYADDKWPEEYRGNLFNGNPVTQKINRDRLEWHGSTPQAIRMPDFLTSDDPWFRPVFLKLGPDGALYIADFYNAIIGHYEVPLTDPHRDHTHGRIWRVVYRGKGAAAGEATAPGRTTIGSTTTEAAPKGTVAAAAGIGGDQKSISVDPRATSRDRLGIDGDRNRISRDENPISGDAKRTSGDQNPISRDQKTTSGDTKSTSGGPKMISGGIPAVTLNQSDSSQPDKLATTPLQPPDLSQMDAPTLIEKLADPSLEVRRLATNELVDRIGLRTAAKQLQHWLESLSVGSPDKERLKRRDLQLAHINWIADRFGILNQPPDTNSKGDVDEVAHLLEIETWSFPDGQQAIQRIKRTDGWMGRRTLVNKFELSSLLNPGFEDQDSASHVEEAQRLRAITQTISAAATELLAPQPADADDVTKRIYEDGHTLARWTIGRLLICWDYIAGADDIELIYALRMALRDCLRLPEVYGAAYLIADSNPQAAEHLADVSLAITTPDSAIFLLSHLERTKLETPRAGEYLKHAVLYLPAEKLDAVMKLVGQVGDAPLPRKLALATNLADAARQRGGVLPEKITQWPQSVILEALASNSDDLAKPAVAAVRDMELEAKLAPLAKIVRDETRDGALRLAALEAAANLPASRDLLAATFADPRNMPLRRRAGEILAVGGDFGTVLPAITQAPWELAVSIASGLARTDPGATALLAAIEAGKAPARVLMNRAVAGPFFSRPTTLRDRAKALAKDLPPEDARLDKVIAERADAFRKAKPDAQHGAQVFQQNCVVCHRFRNAGGNVGPNLDGVVARGPARLIEDILDPSRNVDPGFRQTIIETTNGQTFAGVNLRTQGDTVQITDATGKDITISKSTIKTQTQTQLSLMPPAFESTIPAGEFNDLLAYLLGPAK